MTDKKPVDKKPVVPNSKEYIFGILFLKRCSDVFDQRREVSPEVPKNAHDRR